VARIREQPAYAQLSERAREPGEPQPRASLDRAEQEQLQRRLDEQVREHFPDRGVQRVDLLQHGDDPSVEPGDLLVQVFTKETGETGPCRPGTGTTRRSSANFSARSQSSSPAPDTLNSSGPARTAARARAGTGSVPRQTIWPGASGTSPPLTSGSDPQTWRRWTR
jgi:hypothetical protein